MEHSTAEGQRSAVTRLGLLQRKPFKKAVAPLRSWLQRAESFQDVWKFRWCGGTSWAGSAGQAGLWPTGSCFAQGALDPGRRTWNALCPLFWHSEGQRAGRGCVGNCRGSLGCRLERPGRLSELRDGKQTVCIGLLRKAGLSRYSGQQSLRVWYCVPLSSPNMQHTSPHREWFRDIRLPAKGLGFLQVWAGERSLTQPQGSVSASPHLPVVLQRAL